MPTCPESARRAASRPANRLSIDALRIPGLVSILFFTAGSALGQITTTSDADPPPMGSLRREVELSGAGDTIDVRIGTEDRIDVIDLRTTITFDNDVTIDGSNLLFSPLEIEAPVENSLFEIEADVDLILRDIGIGDDRRNRDDFINLEGAGSSLTLDIERAPQIISVDIIGLGSVIKEGSEALELFGINTFLGGLTILEGDVIGDSRSFGTTRIDLAPDAASKTARLIYDVSGFQAIEATGPFINDMSTNGGTVLLSKQGSGFLDISNARIDSTIGIRVERGTIVASTSNFENGHDFTIDFGATLDLQFALSQVSSASSLTGAGTFRTDAGFLTLTGDLTGFTGLFDVRSSLLSLGPGARVLLDPTVAPGVLDFDLVIDDPIRLVFLPPNPPSAFLVIDNDGLVFSGNISGEGTFVKLGTGTTELTGLATHSGGTQVLGGTLRGNLGNLQGDIALSFGASLVMAQETNGTFGGTISSFGSSVVDKTGNGVVTLLNLQPFSGTLNVTGGGLYFSAGSSLPNAGLTIGMGGSGNVVTLGADFDPLGGANNTIAIGGPLTINSDARVTVGIGGLTTLSTRYAATGAVTIQPGAELVVVPDVGLYTDGQTFDVLTGASLTGDFLINQSLFFFDLSGAAVGNAYRILLTDNGNTLESVATTPNQEAIGVQLDLFRLAPNGGDLKIIGYQASIASADVAQIETILDSTSPDILSAPTQIQLASALRTWRGISDRLALHRDQGIGHHDALARRRQQAQRNAAERARKRRGSKNLQSTRESRSRERMGESLGERRVGPWVAWIQGSGLLGELDSSDAKGFDYITAGSTLGADRALTEDVRFGFALAGMYNRFEANESDDKGDGGSVEGTLYGAWLGDPVEVLIGARYAHAWVESERVIQVGFESDKADGDFEGDIFGAYVELTRGFELPQAIEIAPLVSVAYTRLAWGDFDEGGPSPLRMEVDEQDIDSLVTSLGFRIATEREMDDGFVFRPRFKALWNHEWADTDREISGNFASDPTTGLGPFRVEGAEIPSDHAELSVGWEVSYVSRANLYLNWDGRFGEDLIENSISVGARVIW